jgi:hypothetical protein
MNARAARSCWSTTSAAGTFAHGYFSPGSYRVRMHSEGPAAASSPFLDVEVGSWQTLIL